MSTELIKSPMQLKFELDKTNKELGSLIESWKKKKDEYSGRVLTFRAELKEMDAVMAAKEESYTSHCDLAKSVGIPTLTKLNEQEGLLSESSPSFRIFLNQLLDITRTAEEAESNRISRLRNEHQTRSAYIQQKTKDIYGLMNKENKNVDTYTILLQAKILELEEQLFHLQNKNSGLGLGL